MAMPEYLPRLECIALPCLLVVGRRQHDRLAVGIAYEAVCLDVLSRAVVTTLIGGFALVMTTTAGQRLVSMACVMDSDIRG